MATIDRLPFSMQTDMKTMEKGGTQNPTDSVSPFSMILGEFEQLLLTLSNSDSHVELQKELEGVEIEELPEWTEEQWQEISAMLTAFLQQARPILDSAATGIQKQEGQNSNGWQSMILNQEKKDSLSLANVLPILHKMNQQGIDIPQDVAEKFNKVMQNLSQGLSRVNLQNLMDEQAAPSLTFNHQRPMERGLVILPPQLVQEVQPMPIAEIGTRAEFELKGSSSVTEVASPIFGAQFNRVQFQPVKPEIVPIQKENFLQEMTDFLLSKIKVSPLPNGTEARVSLYPEQLGQVDVKITLQQGQMIAQFVAETNMGRELLEANLAGLRSALQQQGIQVTKFEVQTAAEAGLLNQQQQSQHQSGTNQQNHQKSKRTAAMARVERVNIEAVDTAYDYSPNSTGINGYTEKSIDFTA